MKKLFILHFSPLELYPPIQNLLSYLKDNFSHKNIFVITTATNVAVLKDFKSASSQTKIIHLGKSGQNLGLFARYWSYLFFNLGSIIYLIIKSPSHILYYETLSAFPVYIYKRYFNKQSKVFIHYHEYTSPKEYEAGMILTKWFHNKEKWLYAHACWVSHTNEFRMNHFLNDIKPIELSNTHVFPNYPSIKWGTLTDNKISNPLRVVYVGALSMDTMYTKEFAEWVMLQKGQVIWDIYSYNITAEAKAYLSGNDEWISLKSGVNYDELPPILKNYNVGVILYNGHIPNYIYNAPNKLFEYMACGLDVWFPGKLTGSHGYITHDTYPKVYAFNFTKLDQLSLNKVIDREGFSQKVSNYYSENVSGEIAQQLMTDNN